MPSRNTIREFAIDNYYHVYNRGVEKRTIFLDEQDYTVFLGLLKKHLIGVNDFANNRHKSKSMSEQIELLAYCLMPNHFHLLFYLMDDLAITELMKKLSTGYVIYFNHKYNRVGGLFQGRYKASRIGADDYLHHISRYIHMNPENYEAWPYSSFVYYATNKHNPWLNTQKVLQLFDGSKSKYVDFVKDYKDNKNELSLLKWQLANDLEE